MSPARSSLEQLLASELDAMETYGDACAHLDPQRSRQLAPIYRQHRVIAKTLRRVLGPTPAAEHETPWDTLPHRQRFLGLVYGHHGLLALLRRGEQANLQLLAQALRPGVPRSLRGLVRRRVLPRLRDNLQTLDDLLRTTA